MAVNHGRLATVDVLFTVHCGRHLGHVMAKFIIKRHVICVYCIQDIDAHALQRRCFLTVFRLV